MWTAIFAIGTFTVWMVAWEWLARSGISAGWHQNLDDGVQAIAYFTYGAMPLLGMALAFIGLLPGTKRKSDV